MLCHIDIQNVAYLVSDGGAGGFGKLQCITSVIFGDIKDSDIGSKQSQRNSLFAAGAADICDACIFKVVKVLRMPL